MLTSGVANLIGIEKHTAARVGALRGHSAAAAA